MIARIGPLVILALGLATAAQDTLLDADAFDTASFDQSFEKSKRDETKNKLEYLPGVSFVSEADAYLADSSHDGSDARFYGTAFIKANKADIGSLYAGCNFNYFLYAASDNDFFRRFYQVQSPDPSAIAASLSELHFSFDVNKVVFIRVGKQLIKWGASYFWSPEDFINLEKLQAAVLSPVDRRVGKPAVRLHIPIRRANLFLFTDFSSVTENGMARSLSEKIAQAWRLDATISGVHIGTTGYISKNGPTHIGFDATGNMLATDIYGECALTFPRETSPTVEGAFSVGASRFFGQEKNWTGRTEFYYNHAGFADTGISTLPPGAFTPFYSGKYYAYAEISGTRLLSTRLDCSLFGFVNLADGSYSPTLQGTFDFPGVVPFTLFVRYFGGPQDREFTSPYGGRTWQCGLRILVAL